MATIAAHDGVGRTPSKDPDVHRLLTVLDPPLWGADIANLQRAVRRLLESRGLGRDEIPVPDDGKFTLATELACIEAQYFLGLRSDTYLKRGRFGHRILTEGGQRIIREPRTRDDDQLLRAQVREAQMDRGARYYAELAERMGLRGRGAEDAVRFAASHVGVKERPAGSSSGPLIDAWCRLAGYTTPVPWCGCFVNACIVAAGLPSGAAWTIGFAPAIVAHAKSGAAGWSWHAVGQRGDLALFGSGPGGPSAVHVEIVRERLSRERYSTYGGNTSSGTVGSQTNGGVVARRDDRSIFGAFHIVGFARPPYAR